MSDQFSISIKEWLGSLEGDSARGATNAELEIVVGDYCVTQVEDLDSKTVRSTIRVPVEPVAKWLLSNWWRLRWESEPVLGNDGDLDWAMSHSMAAIGGGFAWPDLIFSGSDGSNISLVCSRQMRKQDPGLSSVRFLNNFSTFVSAQEFETVTRSFVDVVLSRLQSLDIRRSELLDIWKDLSAEWSNSNYSAYRKMEALLGLEPDQDDKLISAVLKWNTQFGRSAVEEFAAGSNRRSVLDALKETKGLADSVRTFADFSEIDCVLLLSKSEPTVGAAPWQQAQSLAYSLREIWGFAFDPVSDSALADRLSLSEAKLQETKPSSHFSFGVRGPQRKLGLVLNREHAHGRRFDATRLIGDFISSESSDRLLPATGSVTARQKFQRAFAAEFLCPSVMLKERYSNGIEQASLGKIVDEVSSEYNVGRQVVLHHLENRRVLPPGLVGSSLLLA